MAGAQAAKVNHEVETTCDDSRAKRQKKDDWLSGHTCPGFLIPDLVYMRNKLLSSLNTCYLSFLSLIAKSNSK